MREKLKRLLPGYAVRPLACAFAFNLFTYYVTRLISANALHHNLSIGLDSRIPLCTPFIFFYILAYLQWIVGFVVIARDDSVRCGEVLAGEMVAKAICFICFVALPTSMVRPEIPHGGLWNWLTALIYRLDTPDNLFPSIHCLESWICFRGAIGLKRMPKWYASCMLVLSLLVAASTVLVKQHVFLDIPAGILAAEIGLWLSRRLGLGKLLVGRAGN